MVAIFDILTWPVVHGNILFFFCHCDPQRLRSIPPERHQAFFIHTNIKRYICLLIPHVVSNHLMDLTVATFRGGEKTAQSGWYFPAERCHKHHYCYHGIIQQISWKPWYELRDLLPCNYSHDVLDSVTLYWGPLGSSLYPQFSRHLKASCWSLSVTCVPFTANGEEEAPLESHSCHPEIHI